MIPRIMRSTLLAIIGGLLLAGCAGESISETGISRNRAINIAEASCKEYPDRYSYVDRAEWNPAGHYWLVVLADRSGDHSKIYKISRGGEVISSKSTSDERRRDAYDDDEGYYGRRHHYWYY